MEEGRKEEQRSGRGGGRSVLRLPSSPTSSSLSPTIVFPFEKIALIPLSLPLSLSMPLSSSLPSPRLSFTAAASGGEARQAGGAGGGGRGGEGLRGD